MSMFFRWAFEKWSQAFCLLEALKTATICSTLVNKEVKQDKQFMLWSREKSQAKTLGGYGCRRRGNSAISSLPAMCLSVLTLQNCWRGLPSRLGQVYTRYKGGLACSSLGTIIISHWWLLIWVHKSSRHRRESHLIYQTCQRQGASFGPDQQWTWHRGDLPTWQMASKFTFCVRKHLWKVTVLYNKSVNCRAISWIYDFTSQIENHVDYIAHSHTISAHNEAWELNRELNRL